MFRLAPINKRARTRRVVQCGVMHVMRAWFHVVSQMHCVDGRVLLHIRVVAGSRCPRACTPRHRYACACLCGFPVAHLKTQNNDLSVYIYIYFHDAKRCHHCINPNLHERVFTKDPWWILFHPPHVLPLTYLFSLSVRAYATVADDMAASSSNSTEWSQLLRCVYAQTPCYCGHYYFFNDIS